MIGPRLLLLRSLNHFALDGPLWSSATCRRNGRQSYVIYSQWRIEVSHMHSPLEIAFLNANQRQDGHDVSSSKLTQYTIAVVELCALEKGRNKLSSLKYSASTALPSLSQCRPDGLNFKHVISSPEDPLCLILLGLPPKVVGKHPPSDLLPRAQRPKDYRTLK